MSSATYTTAAGAWRKFSELDALAGYDPEDLEAWRNVDALLLPYLETLPDGEWRVYDPEGEEPHPPSFEEDLVHVREVLDWQDTDEQYYGGYGYVHEKRWLGRTVIEVSSGNSSLSTAPSVYLVRDA